MTLDIFSIFDPASSNAIFPQSLFLILSLLILRSLLINNSARAPLPNRKTAFLFPLVITIRLELKRTSIKSLNGLSIITIVIFLLIIISNLLGITPYIFSLSSHLLITLTLALPCWLRIIISGIAFKPKHIIAHFLPDGAPNWLNPFLVIVESSRILVRPITLSFRLAANITAGHVVISLISSYSCRAIFSSGTTSIALLLISSAYFIFEIAICLIQAYIFCLLLALYSNDHPTKIT